MNSHDRFLQLLAKLNRISKKRNFLIMLGLIIGSMVCSESATAINGGELVESGKFEAIGLVRSDCGICTGTLIQGDLVITAAHCFDDCDNLKAKFILHDTIPDNGSNSSHDYLFNGSVIPHPKYKKKYSKYDSAIYDIAIIKLDRDVSQILGIEPIPIAHYKAPRNGSFTIVGFGNTSPACKTLNYRNKYKATFYKGLTGKNMDVRSCEMTKPCCRRNTLTCDGDSGGPALDNKMQITAIVSGHVESNGYQTCPSPGIVVLSEINKGEKYNWIQDQMTNATISP